MDNSSKRIVAKRRHSKFGLASLLIGILNIFIVIYYIRLLVLWFMKHPELVNNPASISGMPVPDSAVIRIIVLLVMEVAGILTGIFGLFEKNRRKLLPIIGIILNGLFLFLTASKLNWKVWGKIGFGVVKLLGG